MLIGGSQADSSRSFTHGFFHDGVKSTQFKASAQYFMRLLPAFDNDKLGTPEFESSYIPYRNKELPEDWKTKTPGFTSWFFVVQGYTFFGKGNVSLLSPLSAVHGGGSKIGKDPILDIRNYAEKSDDPAVRQLTEDKSFKERAAAPTPRYFVLTNVLLMTDLNSKRTENQVGIFTNAAWTDLKGKLASRAGRNDEVISRDWEDFLYGDVTHPSEGLAATVRETSAESNESIRFAGIHFADAPGRLDGHQKWDLTDTPQALTNRYVISDDESVTRIWSYDEILHYLVEDGIIPHDVIERACSQYAEHGVPSPTSQSRNADYSLPSQVQSDVEEEDSQPANTIGSSTPTPPTPATPAVEKVAEVAPAPKVPAEAAAGSSTAEPGTNAPSDEGGDDQARYNELSAKFKENPNNLAAEELPEFFDLCAKLGVSPNG